MIDSIRKRSFQTYSDELLGLSESLRYIIKHQYAVFPVQASFPDPPDIVLTWPGNSLSIEVRRVTRQRLSEVSASLKAGEILELDQNLYFDQRARRNSKATCGVRSGDFRSIKNWDEPLNGRGWVGNEWPDEIISMLSDAIEAKQQLLSAYQACSKRVWLMLIDCSGVIHRVSHDYIATKVGKVARQSEFEKILLISFSGEVCELTSIGR